jgi:phosphoribosylformylglycinamidine cyclo-ligase
VGEDRPGTGPAPGLTYAAAGVDIDAGGRAVDLIKDLVRSTRRPEVIGDIGAFGGLFALDTTKFRVPVLVATTDGVGTKAQVARATGRLSTIGIDLVAMCVDDLVCQGAEPLFFLDYVAVGKLDPTQVGEIVEGVAAGCRQARCALIGGEMAEHPGSMEPEEFDLVGFAVGIAERDRLLDGSAVRAGDVVIGLLSPGLRSNGYSLARTILFDRESRDLDGPAWPGATRSLADELLEPSVIYAPAVARLLDDVEVDVRAIAHITGGGIPGNLTRVLPAGADAVVRRSSWEQPPIFGELQRLGGVSDDEMARVFNLGLGMIVIVPPADQRRSLELLATAGIRAVVVGEVTEGTGAVHLIN